jgi:Cu2+-exporting ATPase
LAEINTVVFDKTGTLTMGKPRLVDTISAEPEALAVAAAMAANSRHPVSTALSRSLSALPLPRSNVALLDISEWPGLGIQAKIGESVYRLGRAEWALRNEGTAECAQTVLARDGTLSAVFSFEDGIRPGAATAVTELERRGLRLEILSGDREAVVAATARQLGIPDHAAGLLPAAKVDRIKSLADRGRNVLMVGDGLNDAPALAAAHVSMAPAAAADIGRAAADFIFLHESLTAVPAGISLARKALTLVKQNFLLALAYNVIALPLAVAGLVTPLIAAVAMSLSSITVVANALRLKAGSAAPSTSVVKRGASTASTRLVAAR